MKNFLRKYIGIILSSVMIILVILSYLINSTRPKTAITFQHIVITYIIVCFGLIFIYLEIKFFKWLDKRMDKFEDWLSKKFSNNENKPNNKNKPNSETSL